MRKEIPGFEGRYSIDENGVVMNMFRSNRICAVKLSKRTGYYGTSLTMSSGIRVYPSIHRLVALTFIPNPKNKPEVNHLDGDKSNNHISNLVWATAKENINHAYSTGLMNGIGGEKCHKATISNETVLEIFNSPLSNRELATLYNLDYFLVYQIKAGINWSSVTGKYGKKNKILAL